MLSVRWTVQAPDFALRLVRVSGTFMKYEWDAAKASANLAKHDVSFDDAGRALEDPRKIEFLDDRFDYGEERMQSICIERDRVLFVVSVMRGNDVCRIISARKADRDEQERYFQRYL